MHDAAPAFDTFVIDDPDEPAALPPLPAIGRVSTEDLVAHVIVNGLRHRRTPDLRNSACGDEELHSQFAVPVREALTFADGDPCPKCFTPYEIKRAAENDAAAANAADEEAKKRAEADEARKSKRWRTPTPTGDR